MKVSSETLLCEVVDLNDWVKPLNILDSSLEAILRSHGQSIILLWDKGGPPKQRNPPVDSRAIVESISQVNIYIFFFDYIIFYLSIKFLGLNFSFFKNKL